MSESNSDSDSDSSSDGTTPPLANAPALQSPPHPGDRHFHGFLVNMYCAGLCSPSVTCTFSHCFPFLQISQLCVFCDIPSPKAVYRLSYPFFRPKKFSPSDHVRYHSRTLGAHALATVVGPSPNGPQFCHIRYSVLFSYPEVLYRSFGSSITFVLDEAHWHQRESRFTRVLFACISGGYHSLP